MKETKLSKTCKYCRETHVGTIEELREIFIKQPNCKFGLQSMCK